MAGAQGEKTAGGDPITLGDGSFRLTQTDLSFPGVARPLEFRRSYSSRSDKRSELGSNWTHNWDVRLVAINDLNRPEWADPFCAGEPNAVTCVLLDTGDSSRLYSRDPLTGVYTPQAGDFSSIVHLTDGWLLTQPDMRTLRFDKDGYLIADSDRFGNTFSIEWELSPAGRVFEALCPDQIIVLDTTPVCPQGTVCNNTTLSPRYVYAMGGRYSANSAQCELLGGMIEQRVPIQYQPSNQSFSALISLPPDPGTELTEAYALLSRLETGPGRGWGALLPSGARRKRVKQVLETQVSSVNANAPSGSWRHLDFEYWPESDLTHVVTGSASLPRAGLLRRVSGPAGTAVEFDYSSADSHGHPSWLNEVFLTTVTRNDEPSTGFSDLSPSVNRSVSFTYAWTRNAISTTELADLNSRYLAVLDASKNCTFYTINSCQEPVRAAQELYFPAVVTANLEGSMRAQLADNIVKVVNKGVLESETHYQVGLFAPDFDYVTAQRYGSSYATPSPPSPLFESTLPEVRLSYAEAEPTAGGQGDATTAFLGSDLAARYPLEAVPLEVVDEARNKGLLLARDTSVSAQPLPYPPISAGFVAPGQPPSRACRERDLPFLRTRLPQYRASFDYFDVELPTGPTPGSALEAYETYTPGVDLGMRLKRSRLSCAALAIAQTSDVAHNDLQWTFARGTQTDELVFKKLQGRRAQMNANANRICAWSRLVDRDGDIHVYGLNYHGRALVDAVMVSSQGSSSWRIAETLYNADGSVIAQRKTSTGSQPWSPTIGDVRYQYYDVPRQVTGQSAPPMPLYWARRGNVVSIVQRPPGGAVQEFEETAARTPVTTKGRYVDFSYEPLFNQIRAIRTGAFSSTLTKRETQATLTDFDYQEDGPARLASLLQIQRAMGFSHETVNGVVQAPSSIQLNLGDLNGDNLVGSTILGLPVRVRVNRGTSTETATYRWNSGGRVTRTTAFDGVSRNYHWLNYGSLTGSGTSSGNGLLAKVEIEKLQSVSGAFGPPRPRCERLSGPYQWLLTEDCSEDLESQIAQLLAIPSLAAKTISDYRTSPGTATSYEYFPTGHVHSQSRTDDTKTIYTRDTDGLFGSSSFFDRNALRSSVVVQYTRQLPTTVSRYDSAGQLVDRVVQAFDEEDRLLFSCQELEQAGCTITNRGDLPVKGVSRTLWWSPEGNLEREQDPEGARVSYQRDSRKWVVKRVQSAANETSRETQFRYDDDGRIQETLFGVTGSVATLSAANYWDGYGRIRGSVGVDGVEHWAEYSPRDVLVHLELSNSRQGLGNLWQEYYRYDDNGRAIEKQVNGITVHSWERAPGGRVFKELSYGREPVFKSYDEEGRLVWQEGPRSVQTSSFSATNRLSLTAARSDGSVEATLLELDADSRPEVVTRFGRSTSSGAILTQASRYTRDTAGNVTSSTDANGRNTTRFFDLAHRVVREEIEQGTQLDATTYEYDRRGRVLSVTNPANDIETLAYSGFGQLVSHQTAGGQSDAMTWQYDLLGRVSRRTEGGRTIDFGYDEFGLLRSLQDKDKEEWREFKYDGLGRLLTAANGNRGAGEIPSAERQVFNSWQYDDLGRVRSESIKVGSGVVRTTTSTWGGAWSPSYPNPISRTVQRADGSFSDEQYDSDGQVLTISRESLKTQFKWASHRESDRLSSLAAGSELEVQTQRDGLGRALSRAASIDSQLAHELTALYRQDDSLASISRQLWPSGETEWNGYEYSNSAQISTIFSSAVIPDLSGVSNNTIASGDIASIGRAADSWNYDRLTNIGTLTAITSNQATQRYSATPDRSAGQLTEYVLNGHVYSVSYDNAGRVASEGSLEYNWDAFGFLTSVSEGGREIESLQYDAIGRLVARWSGGVLLSEYLWDGNQMVGSLASCSPNKASCDSSWSAWWGPGIDNLVSVARDGEEYLALEDGRGGISAWIQSSTGLLTYAQEYTPEGRARLRKFDSLGQTLHACDERDTNETCDASAFGTRPLPFSFHAAYRLPGSGLFYFRNRWYSSAMGQFLTQDPLGTIDSHNVYAFNAFDAVNHRDPWGLAAEPALAAAVKAGWQAWMAGGAPAAAAEVAGAGAVAGSGAVVTEVGAVVVAAEATGQAVTAVEVTEAVVVGGVSATFLGVAVAIIPTSAGYGSSPPPGFFKPIAPHSTSPAAPPSIDVANPWGQPGNPDHQWTIKEWIDYLREKGIPARPGQKGDVPGMEEVIPDIYIERDNDNEDVVVIEIVRIDSNGRPVRREREKANRYDEQSKINRERGAPEIKHKEVPVERSPDWFWNDRAEKARQRRKEEFGRDERVEPGRFDRKEDNRNLPRGKGKL